MTALQPTSLTIEPGEFFSLIGPSGSGKTTLLGVTAGYIAPSSGHIRVDDRDLIGVPPFKRNIGMVFQNYSLFPHMSVAENIAFPLRMRRVGRVRTEERVKRMLAMVRLEGMGERRPSQLSGGQQQRVALARAAIYDPLLLLMDEPLSALDKNLREQMQFEVKQFQEALGATVLYVTHDQAEAAVHVAPHRDHQSRKDRAARHGARDVRAAGQSLRRKLSGRGQHLRGGAPRAARRGRRGRHSRGVSAGGVAGTRGPTGRCAPVFDRSRYRCRKPRSRPTTG